MRGDGGYIIWWAACGLAVHEHWLAPWPDALMPLPATNIRQFMPVVREDETVQPDRMNPKLVGIFQRLRRAREGERNAIAFWAACRLADMLRSGELKESWGYAADLLLLASSEAGLPEVEARKTIASGLRA